MCSTEAALAKKTEPIVSQEKYVDYQLKAKVLVVKYFNDNAEMNEDDYITTDDVYVVWFTKVLRNWKALLSTTIPDGMYYELTYDGEKKATYLDAYKKFKNVAIPD